MKNKILAFLLIFPIWGLSQDSLTIDDAIMIALKNNYDIQLEKNTLMQAENNQSIYNSGFLPTVTATGNGKYANSSATLSNQMGEETSINGVETKGYGGSVGLNYLLYNGGARKYQYDLLKKMYDRSNLDVRIQVENTLLDVYTTFFNVARTQEQYKTIEEAYKISKERLDRVIVQQQYGKNTTLDILNARVDANKDSINLMNVQVALENNKRNLNFILGREINTSFEASKKVALDNTLSYQTLLEQVKANNSSLRQIEISQAISQQELKINRAGWLPSVTTNVSYGLNYNDNGPTGFFAEQQTQGVNAGINLSWNIFDGGSTKVRVQNAKINLETQELNKQKASLNIENQLAIYWADYTTQKAIIKNEELNVEISNQNFLKSKELFNLGKVSSLDFRQAQLNLINTKLNLLNAIYNAKIAELQLKKIAGLINNQ